MAGQDGLVANSIMNAGGYKSQGAAIKALTQAGNLIADYIGLEPSESDMKGVEPALSVLGYRSTVDTEVPLHLILHKELRDAVWQTL